MTHPTATHPPRRRPPSPSKYSPSRSLLITPAGRALDFDRQELLGFLDQLPRRLVRKHELALGTRAMKGPDGKCASGKKVL